VLKKNYYYTIIQRFIVVLRPWHVLAHRDTGKIPIGPFHVLVPVSTEHNLYSYSVKNYRFIKLDMLVFRDN